ncbi:MAG: DNA/RNA non-specific endonuclease [Desulfuromonadaceae bacterium]
MSDYSLLHSLISVLPKNSDYADYEFAIVPYLIDSWLSAYRTGRIESEIVEVNAGEFYYLFDVITERLIAAWGVSAGKNTEPRPASRMAGHPLSNGPLYHRGHAIPHTLGGGTDINLVPQLGSVNVGAFRELEKRAVATPGSFYFSRWIYAPGDSQTPLSVEQGFLFPGTRPDIRLHQN